MENIVATFNFMKGEGIKIVNIDSTDIMQGNMKLTLGLIWTLIFNYQVTEWNELNFDTGWCSTQTEVRQVEKVSNSN